jgi:hypothetical protein
MAALAGALVAGIASVTLPAVDPRAGWRWVRRAATSPAPVGRSARGALLIAVGAAIVVEPALLGRAAVAVGGVLLVVVGIAQFSAMRAPSGEAAPATAPAGRAGPRPWAPAVAVVLVVALTGLAMALVLPGPRAVAVPIAGEPGGCNGLRAMCERRLDQSCSPPRTTPTRPPKSPGGCSPTSASGSPGRPCTAGGTGTRRRPGS